MTDGTTLTGISEATPQTEENAEQTSYLDNLVGVGKKYADNEGLAKAYNHASLRVKELSDESDEKDANSNLLKEVLTELRSKPTEPEVEPVPDNIAPTVSPQVSSDDIAKQVHTILDNEKAVESFQTNTNKTLELLTEFYGDRNAALKAINSLTSGANDVKQMLDKLGGSNPTAAVKFITGAAQKPSEPTPNLPGVGGGGPSADSIVSSKGGLTWAQCRKIKKDNPRDYASQDFRERMAKAVSDAQKQGVDFFAT